MGCGEAREESAQLADTLEGLAREGHFQADAAMPTSCHQSITPNSQHARAGKQQRLSVTHSQLPPKKEQGRGFVSPDEVRGVRPDFHEIKGPQPPNPTHRGCMGQIAHRAGARCPRVQRRSPGWWATARGSRHYRSHREWPAVRGGARRRQCPAIRSHLAAPARRYRMDL